MQGFSCNPNKLYIYKVYLDCNWLDKNQDKIEKIQ